MRSSHAFAPRWPGTEWSANVSKRDFANSTEAVHAGALSTRPHHTLSMSIAQTATFTFDGTTDLRRYMSGEDPDPEREEYGRYGNPTVRELERRVAHLERGDDAVAYSSGMAAIATVLMTLLKAGEHVVTFQDCYRRTRQLITQTLTNFGIEHTVIPSGDLAALEQAIRPNTKIVFGESPTNPYLFCTDLPRMVELVKRRGRIRTVVDATFATPVNCRPIDLGVDLVIHSATKYLSGHNDVLGGLVIGPDHLVSLLRETRHVVGNVLDPHAAWLVARGLKTLGLRVARQNATALAVARTLEQHPKVQRVFYPELESHPSHAIAREQMNGSGGVVSFIVEGGKEAAARVVDGSRLGRIAPSFGGVETLIEQPCNMSYFEFSADELKVIGIDPGLIRLSVGIEETSDVVADIVAALAH
jgi:cystathionine gamma-synthase